MMSCSEMREVYSNPRASMHVNENILVDEDMSLILF